MNELKDYKYVDDAFYQDVKSILEEARKRVYRNIVISKARWFWLIGKLVR